MCRAKAARWGRLLQYYLDRLIQVVLRLEVAHSAQHDSPLELVVAGRCIAAIDFCEGLLQEQLVYIF